MYLCICNAVKEGDKERYHLIGTNCGKCKLHWPEPKLPPINLYNAPKLKSKKSTP